jgi:hypothetical protein
MASLRDQSFNREAWLKLGGIGALAGLLAGLVYLSVLAHERFVSTPRLLEDRHRDPVGHPGMTTASIAKLGAAAVDTLIADLGAGVEAGKRRKSIEVLSAIDDPRVLPALRQALTDADLGVRVAAIAGMVRHGDRAAAADLWAALEGADDWLGERLIIALGLIGAEADGARCLARANAARGRERQLFAWAAGQIARRATDRDKIGRLPPAPRPETEDDERRIQAEVEELLAACAAGPVTPALALALARKTAVEFGTWDIAHQIGFQTLAISGPLALRGVARIDAVARPRPAARQPEVAPDAAP